MRHYNLFISHAWKYSEHYYKIVQWLNEAQDEGFFTWKNYSVPKHDPLIDPSSIIGQRTLKKELIDQMRLASKILILSGMYSAYSNWINFELNTALRSGKYIIGIKPWGQERIPIEISNNVDKIVGWNKYSVINAILDD